MEKVFDQMKERMEKSLAALEREYAGMRAGRASAAVLDKIVVDYYGVPTPVQQMAAVSVQEGRILTIQPWDASTIKPIEKAIQASDIGINPMNDGRVIRLTFPPLTEERRKELSKDVKAMGEECKVKMRNIRRDAIDQIKAMKKASEITEDDQKNAETKIQKITDDFVKKTDDASTVKEKEIMEI
ncbi:MAG: ribosome recycling factor [Oscillospiraceae bacterium]|nr:ribosome recycling factor [Oscillospiraceae bacterium]